LPTKSALDKDVLAVNTDNTTQCVSDKNNALHELTHSVSDRVHQGLCVNCGGAFEKKTTWQKYCCEGCRVSAYELRTGKKIKLKEVNHG
jgi:Zn finger protein HypA/HybF involved in hydrogenase expression